MHMPKMFKMSWLKDVFLKLILIFAAITIYDSLWTFSSPKKETESSNEYASVIFSKNETSNDILAELRDIKLKMRTIEERYHSDMQKYSSDIVAELKNVKKKVRTLEEEQNSMKSHGLKTFPDVKYQNYRNKKRILITGGGGFVGSHLVDRLMSNGHEVTVVDNFFTGKKENVERWIGHKDFELIHHDIVNPLYIEIDEIYHLASPASPPHYMFNPVKTIKTNTIGTNNMLGLAKRVGAKILIASTSEVYGDPEVHPQPETYWGHVNPIGPRACYDEGKRVSETLSYAYAKQENVSVRVARIFNTYGPRMNLEDGRVVSNFILQALKNETITVYGNGTQTRSFQFVSDLVDGLIALMNSNYTLPVNLGNPSEHTITEFAVIIKKLVGGNNKIAMISAVEDDPQRRKPDITRAMKYLNWKPKVPLKEGLKETIEYFKKELIRQRIPPFIRST